MLKIMLTAALLVWSTLALAQVNVDSYTRKDGTYVPPHQRTNPDRSYNNNWSTSPNLNPNTGQRGTNSPTGNDRPPPAADPYGLRR